jgi:hypothetical protein
MATGSESVTVQDPEIHSGEPVLAEVGHWPLATSSLTPLFPPRPERPLRRVHTRTSLSLFFPLLTQSAPVSPLFPLLTQKQGVGGAICYLQRYYI